MINTIFEYYFQKLITMKNLFLVLASIPLLFACNPENNPSEEKNNPKELIVTAEASEIECTSATLFGYANLSEGMTGVTFGIIISVNENPTVENGKVVKSNELDSNNKFYCKVTDLSVETTYYYKAYLKEGDFYHTGSKTLSFTTKDYVYSAQAVDMGLSVKWASFNLGASKPEEYGFYYAWGETRPKDNYTWDTYKWGNPSSSLTKYNNTDKMITLEQTDDVAHVKLGGKWRMPTDEEWSELRQKCTWKWTSMNGVDGRRVTGPNGNSIFLPAVGARDGLSLLNPVNYGDYWSSSLNTDDPSEARLVFINVGYVNRSSNNRYRGLSIRPVSE